MEQTQQIQQLLESMEKNSRKQLFYSRAQCLFSIIAAVCCVFVLLVILELAPEVLSLARQADVVMDNLETVTTELTQLDLENMVKNIDSLVTSSQEGVKAATDKLDQIDFDTLNDAIADLSDVVEPLAKIANRFK